MSFVICLPYTAGTVTMCVVAISSVAFTIVLTSYSSFKMFYDKTLSIQFKSFYYLSNISWIVAASGHAMNACFPLLLTNCWDAIGPLAFIGFWGYAIAFTLLYLLFVYKLHIIFKPSTLLLIHLLVGALVMATSQAFTGYYYGIVQFDKAYIAGTIWLFAHIFYWTTILFVFIYKIYRLYFSIFKHPTNSPPALRDATISTETTNATSNATTLNELTLNMTWTNTSDRRANNTHIQKPNIDALFRPAVRCLMCVFIALLSTLGADFMTIYRGWITEIDTPELIQIHVGLNSLDAFINVLCLNLQFLYFDRLYQCICCPGVWCFDRWIRKHYQAKPSDADRITTNEATQTDLPPLKLHKDMTEMHTDTLPVHVV
eukprot:205247_1